MKQNTLISDKRLKLHKWLFYLNVLLAIEMSSCVSTMIYQTAEVASNEEKFKVGVSYNDLQRSNPADDSTFLGQKFDESSNTIFVRGVIVDSKWDFGLKYIPLGTAVGLDTKYAFMNNKVFAFAISTSYLYGEEYYDSGYVYINDLALMALFTVKIANVLKPTFAPKVLYRYGAAFQQGPVQWVGYYATVALDFGDVELLPAVEYLTDNNGSENLELGIAVTFNFSINK